MSSCDSIQVPGILLELLEYNIIVLGQLVRYRYASIRYLSRVGLDPSIPAVALRI